MSGQDSSSKYKPLLIESIREIRQLKERLEDLAGDKRRDPIAIVGAGCRFPGASGIGAYWDFLERGGDGVREIPPDRWPVDEHFDPDPARSGKIYTRAAGFIDGIDQFDADFFGISPREASATDPQHRLLLEVAWEALENAAIVPTQLRDTRTGVYVGIMGQDYGQLTRDPQCIDLHTGIGNLASVAAGRLAYWLGVHGPTLSIDTACSSSLVAVHLACQHLRSGEADLALAGGVNLIISPFVMMMISTARMLSPDGRCKTFDQAADGFGRGEGCGIVVLKRLADAQRDGDRVLAVISGTAVNHDGRSAGLTVPSQEAQTAVIRQALADAGVSAHEVQYLEAHGTGTSLGDPIEIAAAAEAYGADRSRPERLVVGSVKTNFGHLEGAAGVASLLKAALAVRTGVVPPHLRLNRPNPHIDWDTLAISVPRTAQPWPPATGHRMAGVSSFGVSGTNAHLILSEPPALPARQFAAPPCRHLLALSAQTPGALQDKAAELAHYLAAGQDLRLEDISYTLLVGRQHFEQRAAFVVADTVTAIVALEAFVQGRPDAARRIGHISHEQHSSAQFSRFGHELAERSRGCRQQAGPLADILLSLADLYCQGHQPGWPELFSGLPVRRIPLPTYPFQRQRYWVAGTAPLAGPPAAGATQLHPLVHRNTSDFVEQRYSSSFDGREFFLADHRVQGRKVLPGVAYLEMARAALAQASGEPGGGVRFRNVVWSRPLVVDDRAVEVHLSLHPQEGGPLAYEVYSLGVEGLTSYGQGLIEAIELPAPQPADLADLRAQCSQRKWLAADCYAKFAETGLHYGAAHQVIEALYLGEGQVLARLVLPSAVAATHSRFGLHPSLLDGALQSLVGLVGTLSENGGQVSLPFALDELEVLGECSERMWAAARFSPGSRPGDRVQKFDLDLYGDDGRVCVRMRGFAARLLEGGLGSDAGTSPATLLLQPDWRSAPAIGEDTRAYGEHLVLLCHSRVDPAALSARLGVRCEMLADDYAEQADALLNRLQALLQERPTQPVLVQLVVPAQGPQRLALGLAGLLRSARLEHPKLTGQVIAVEPEDDAGQLAEKLKENRRCPQDAQIRYGEGERQVLAWSEIDPVHPAQPWKDGGVYLITGGLGGLGRIFAKEIANAARGVTLILTGRRGLDDAGGQQIHELEALGATVVHQAVDVADREAVRRLVRQVREDHAALDGILHCAGVLRDSLLLHKSPQALQDVLAPKVAGLLNLDEATRDLALDCFICFSSISAVRGHVGQADYAAANGFMDAFAAYRNSLVAAGQRRGRTLSVNWPLWREGGMQVDAAIERAVTESTGMGAMPTASGIDALYRAWASGLDQVAVLAGDPARLRQMLAAPAGETQQAEPPVAGAGVPAGSAAELLEKAGQYFRRLFANALHLPFAKVDIDAPLEKYGIDSIIVMGLTTELETAFGSLSKTLFFEYQTLRALAGYFVEHHAAQLQPLLGLNTPATRTAAAAPAPQARTTVPLRRTGNRYRTGGVAKAATPAAKTDIAIIGIAGRYPQARDLAAYWRNLRDGVDCISEIPGDRWDHGRYYDPDKEKPGKTYAKWGGFLDGVAEFDPLFFNIAPRDAELIDPQERLFLQCAYAALEDAGYTREALEQYQALGLKGNVGVYVGVMYEEYQLFAAQQQLLGNPVTVTASPASVANRVSYFLNLHGPSLTVDTMCSSSLTAIHLACESLQRGGCELAIAGGVNVSIHPNKYLLLGQSKLASSKGRCESFGIGGDGYVPGEGVGAVILKPLAKAEADGDHIYGVIKATSVNHAGKTNGYMVPNPVALANVVAQAIKAAGVPPRAISYIEAHGTGTTLGDPIEVAGLSKAFGEYTADRQFCAIGSVKSNIGHTESASGIAGLTKVLLQMQHGQLVPSLHSQVLNPHIDFGQTPFVVQQTLAEWSRPVIEIDGVRQECPRIAGISTFGAGGANAHLIVEEYRPTVPQRPYRLPSGHPALVVLSAKNPQRLQERVGQLLEAIEGGEVTDDNLADAAYTLQVGREAMESRLALAVPSAAALRDKLAQVLQAGTLEDEAIGEVYRGEVNRHRDEWAMLGGDDLARLTDGWLAQGRYGKLLELWVRGQGFDWNCLYGEARPRRISLPTYPFATERCWIPEVATAGAAAAGLAKAGMPYPWGRRDPSDSSGLRSPADSGRQGDEADTARRDAPVQLATAPRIDGGALLDKVRRLLVQTISSLLKVRADDIDPDAEFNEYGFDSVSLTQFGNRLNQDCGTQLTPTLFFEYPTLNGFAAYLAREYASLFAARFGAAVIASAPAPAGAPAVPAVVGPRFDRIQPTNGRAWLADTAPAAREPIAIIGVSGHFPQATDIGELWQRLAAGTDCIGDIPTSRWDSERLSSQLGLRLVNRAGMIEGVDEFDPLFFNISPREAQEMDPQQRLLMTYVWKAVEDAGYSAQSLAGSKTALFVGTTGSGYGERLDEAGVAVEGSTAAGRVPSMGPNRMSYWMDWRGPSEPIDTACSSSLVAIHRAVALLQAGDCDLAVVGGVNTLVAPWAQISFSKAGMLSEDGRCKTFSKDANGYVRGEGVGMLMLKPLSAAERDGDHIYGLIRGSAENHGGKANSLTAPNPRAQADLIKEALERAGVDPATVGYVEAHGTGTPLGDPIEVQGLRTAFAELVRQRGPGQTLPEGYCGLGSIKSNIGHLELAAGVAGVIKVLLQMQHRTLAPSLHCSSINPYIELAGSPFYIVREACEWTAVLDARGNPLPRRAGVSSFGFGGVNAHVVLEEYLPAVAPSIPVDVAHPALVVLSARNTERLQDQVGQLREAIRRGAVTAENLADAAYTLQVGREAMEIRLALVTTSLDDLAAKLDAVLAGEASPDDVYRDEAKGHKQDMALLAADEDATRMLEAWLAKGKFGKLLELWAKGLNFDWARLYGDRRPRRISLPAYPFARERYWVPEAAPAAAIGAAATVLHPLVHRNTSSLTEQRFTTDFTGDEFFLADHLVRGAKVLPGVAHLEMARLAVAQALELGSASVGVCLKNVVFSRPITVTEPLLSCHVGLRPEADGQLAYQIYGREEGGDTAVYSQGGAELIEPANLQQDIPGLLAACGRYRATRDQCYAFFAAHGLVLGPSFRVLQEVHVGDQQVLGRLVLPSILAGQADRFVLHPCMMDAALQASVGLTLAAPDAEARLVLPFALERLEILGPTNTAMWSYVRRSAGSQPGDRVQKFDVDLCNDAGQVCVRFLGFSTRVFEGGTGAPAGDAVAEPRTLLWQPQWRCTGAPQGDAVAYGDHLVLLCDSPVDTAVLSARLGARCERLPDGYAAQAESVLAQLQALLTAKPAAPVLVQLVVPEFGPQQVAAGLAGLIKSARLENSKLIGQVIAGDAEDAVELLAARLGENSRSPQDVQIRYVEGERQVLGWSELATEQPLVPWKAGGVYLITGGLGGLGRIFAKEIAERAKGPVLVLTGRRELDEAGRQQIRKLEALGATVEYQALDVADREAVRQLVLQVQEDHLVLNGIVHSAGVIRDSLMARKTPEALRQVLAAKVAGLVNLDEASREIELDCLICFSSIAAVTGNVGQADYAAANAFMDAYAAYRNSLVAIGQRHGQTLSVNWPLWQDGGMRVDAATERAMEQSTGMVALRTASGIDALYRALGTGYDQVAVTEGNAARLRQLLGGKPVAEANGKAAVDVTVAAPQPAAAPMPTAAGSSPAELIKQLLTRIISVQTKLKPEAIKGDTELNQYGFDSIMLTELGNRLNHEYELDLTPTVFFEYPTLNALAQFLSTRHAAKFGALLAAAKPVPAAAAAPVLPARPQTVQSRFAATSRLPLAAASAAAPAAPEPIAIIGLAGRFPQANDLDALWDNLRSSRDGVTEVPADRWDMAPYYDPQPGRLGKSSSKWGGFIDGIDQFDALFFQISPRDALAFDPQARLFLQTTWSLLESAGYTPESLRQRHQGRVGVYVGAMAQPTHPADDGEKVIAALSASSGIANRVSYFFNFEGPSFAVDTMCSSAMTALHLACRDLQQGECELAVAGGVCLLISPQKYVGMSQARLLGSHPDSRSFTEGDGYQPAETVGAVLLKPLSKAVADGDLILAVIKGTATHNSGRSNGYAAPNPRVQAKVIAESLRRAGVGPDSIGWIEAAAAGTSLSDASEMAALGSVFGELRATDRKVPVGAVKSNFGHAEHGSGMAQLAKVVLQLKHRQLAPLLSIGTPNRQLRLEETPFVLQRELAAWEPLLGPDGRPQPRRALVNSFAAGGTCVSAVIEEYLPAGAQQGGEAIPPGAQLFVFSARDGERLRAVVEQTLQRLEGDDRVVLRDLAYTLQVGREAMDSRLALVATTHAELCERLRTWLDGREAAGVSLFRSADEQAVPLPADESQAEVLVAAGDLDGLAQFWVRGGAVSWTQLHAGKPVRRIVWATYPFAPTVYPIDYDQTSAVRGAAVVRSAAGPAGAAGNTADAAVAQAVAGALGMPAAELPLHKPLQTLGYNSIAVMELKYRLEAAWQRPIELELISDARRTVAELTRQLAESAPERPGGAAASPALPVLAPQPDARYQPFPLTDMQEAFLLGRQSALGGDRVGAHIYLEIEVRGTLDLFRLNRAWNRLIARHEMLRAVIVDGGQHVLQEVPDYRCKTIDFRVMDEVERRFKAGLLRETMEHRVFAGDEWPLFDIRVAIHGDGRYRIHFSIDELIVDGLSVDTLVRQWDRLYADPDQPLPAMELTFRDYVLAMKAFERSDRHQQDLAYWRQQLENLPGGPDLPQPAIAEDDSQQHRTRLNYRLPAAGWQVLQAKAGALGVSPTALVLGVFAEVLRAWSASPTFTLVLTYFNRPPLHPQIRELVGPAISSLLFVVEPPAGDDFEAIVQGHHQRLWQDLDHSSVSGIQALRQLRGQSGRRGRGVPAALPVVFTSMLGSEVTSEPLPHLGEVAYVVNQTPQVYLDHQLRDSAAGLDCSWDVAEGYFAPGFVQAMFDAYGQALTGLAGGQLAWTTASFARPALPIDPLVAQLAGFLAEAQREDPLGPFPLTDQQQAYAFGRDTRLEGGGGSCQFYQELRVERLDVARLEQALASLIARHPMLRTVVDAEGNQAVLALAPRYAIAVADLRRHRPEQRQAALAATRHALLSQATPLGEWPYFAVTVSLLEGETACVHLCFDLMLVDSTSIGQLLIELIQRYEQPHSLPPASALTFRDYQRAVDRCRNTPGYTERLGYWNRKFADLPGGPALPQLAATGGAVADAHQRISGELTHWGALKQYAAAQGVAPGLILLTAYLEVLYAWNGRQPLTVVVPGWERLPVHPDIERVVGDFTTLSWMTYNHDMVEFASRLAGVARQHADDLAQRPVSGLQALRRVMLRDRQRQLRFPVVFTNQITPLTLPSTQFQLGEALSKTPQVYLDNLSSEVGSRLHCSWDFAGGVYAPAMVQEMFDGYLRLLELLGSDQLAWQRTDFSDLIRARRSIYTATLDRLEGVV